MHYVKASDAFICTSKESHLIYCGLKVENIINLRNQYSFLKLYETLRGV